MNIDDPLLSNKLLMSANKIVIKSLKKQTFCGQPLISARVFLPLGWSPERVSHQIWPL